jgi:hypothetical protein
MCLVLRFIQREVRDNHTLLPTLEEHREAFEEAHSGLMRVSRASVGRAIARLPGGWPLKKVEDSPRARRRSQRSLAMAGFPLRR